MYKPSILLTFLLQFLINPSVHAQPEQILNLPTSTPKPTWVDKLDWNHINVLRNDSIIQQYRKKEKVLKNANKKEPFEEPYYKAYQRWLRGIRPYIQPDGSVYFPPVKRPEK